MNSLHLPLCRPVSLRLAPACPFNESVPPNTHWGTWARHRRDCGPGATSSDGDEIFLPVHACIPFAKQSKERSLPCVRARSSF
jgi:hypothetical protein